MKAVIKQVQICTEYQVWHQVLGQVLGQVEYQVHGQVQHQVVWQVRHQHTRVWNQVKEDLT